MTTAFFPDLAWELPDFLTPIIKAYCSDMGFRVCETAIQCLGGYGYCRDYILEQYLRDVKIMSIYEGTNGIQSIDFMGRKRMVRNRAPYRAFVEEMRAFIQSSAPATGTIKSALNRTSPAGSNDYFDR